MKNPISDIKMIRVLTDEEYSISDCKNAYEECNRNVDKAVELLSSRKVTIPNSEMTFEELANFEKYKAEAEKRANKKSKSSRRIRESKVCKLFALLLFLMFVAALITAIVEKNSGWIAPIIVSLVMSIAMLMLGVSVENMTDEEYRKAHFKKIEEQYYSDNDIIRCPHCGSEHLTYQKKGFSEAKALIGMSLIGIWGVMFGVPGKHKIKATCLKCGHSFMIKKK